MTDNTELEDLREVVERNNELLETNTQLLRKLYRQHIWGIWFKVIWYAALIGLPFALYFYVLEPYFAAFGASYETFSAGMQEIPGFKQFHETLKAYQNK